MFNSKVIISFIVLIAYCLFDLFCIFTNSADHIQTPNKLVAWLPIVKDVIYSLHIRDGSAMVFVFGLPFLFFLCLCISALIVLAFLKLSSFVSSLFPVKQYL